MVLRDVRKRIAVLFSIVVLSFGVTGCGGGSSGDSTSTVPESNLIVITEENSEKVIETVFGSMDIRDGFENVPLLKSVASAESAPMIKSIEAPTFKTVLSTSRNLNTIAVSGTEQCSEGGTYSYNGNETSGTITFNNCIESGITINGSMSITSNNEGTSGTITFTNLSLIQDENNKIVYTSVTATFNLNDNYDTVDMSMTINGYVVVSGERTDFDNYKLTLAMDSNYNTSITINGSVKSDCISGWVEIRTNEAMLWNAYDDCPSAGQIVIGGNASSLTIDFNVDGSVDVSGSVSDHYNSCNDLDTGVCGSL
jgi:hypothetical protein